MKEVRTCPRGHQWESVAGTPASCPLCAESSTQADGPTDELEDRVAEAILSYQQAVEAGRRPDRVDFLRRHAALAEHLEPLLSAVLHADALLTPLSALATKHDDPSDTPTPDGSRFRRLRFHDRGGQGEVFVAVDTELNREVALKEIQDRFADHSHARARFVREAEITGNLQHPGIVPVYGLGAYPNGRPFYAMRFIEGDSLKEAIDGFHNKSSTDFADSADKKSSGTVESVKSVKSADRFSGLVFRKLLDRFVAVCNAVGYAHSRGVLHRDLKPGNIMLGKYGETLVVDWGLAKASGGQDEPATPESLLRLATERDTVHTQPGKELGTIPYMSPEQAAGRLDQLGPPSDVYSLGATLYHLLTGAAAFAGRDRDAIMAKVKAGDFAPPRRVQSTVPRPLEAICLKAMALHAADRYLSARELAEEVERWLANEPVRAWPEPWTIKTGRWLRAHKPLVSGAAAALLVTMLSLTAGSLWYQHDLNRRANARDVAETSARLALDQAEQNRADLHAILQKPGGVFGLLNDPAGWQAKIQAAHALLDRARAVLAGADEGVDPELAERAAGLHTLLDRDEAERVFAVQLEKIRMDRSALVDGHFDNSKAATDYPRTFAEAGFAVLEDEPAAIAARFSASPIREQLLTAIDDWTFVAWTVGKKGVPEALVQMRQLADPDPAWRDRLRQLMQRRDMEVLGLLIKEAPAERLTAPLFQIIESHIGQDHPLGMLWLRRAQAQYPRDFWLNFGLGSALMKANPVEAAGFYRVAVAVRPTSSAAYTSLGVALKKQKQLPEAIAAYRKAIELDSKFASPYSNLGVALRDQKQLPEAIAACRKAIDLDSKFAMAYNNLGGALSDQNQMPDAIAAFRKAIDLDPKYASAYNNLGIALRLQERLPEAIAAWRKAIDVDPKDGNAYCYLGSFLYEQKELSEAIAAYHKAIDRDPKIAVAYAGLGSALSKQKKFPEAIAAFRKAIELDPDESMAYNNLGVALRDQKQLPEAIAACRRAIELGPKNANAYANLGAALADQKQLPEAIAAYRRAIELDPKLAAAYNYLGLALREQKQLPEAIAAHGKAIEIDPKFAMAYHNLGAALANQNQLREAIAAFRKTSTCRCRRSF